MNDLVYLYTVGNCQTISDIVWHDLLYFRMELRQMARQEETERRKVEDRRRRERESAAGLRYCTYCTWGQEEEREGECCRTQVMYLLYMRTGGGERGRVLQFSGSVLYLCILQYSWGKLLYLEEIFKKSIKCLVKRILKTCWKLNKKYCANFWKFSEDYSINGCNINHFNLFFVWY